VLYVHAPLLQEPALKSDHEPVLCPPCQALPPTAILTNTQTMAAMLMGNRQ
jgi:hypothetical protein